MDIPSTEPPNSYSQTDQSPLLMERVETLNDRELIIDIPRNETASLSASHDDQPSSSSASHNDEPSRRDLPRHEDRSLSSTRVPTHQNSMPSSNRSSSRSSSFMRRGDGYSRRRRSPLNSGMWISVELVVTVSQIIASIVVLALSRNEKPQAPLFAWVVGYASGCIATLPLLYWRYRNRNQGSEQDSTQSHQGSSQSNPSEPASYTAISVSQASNEDQHTTGTSTLNHQVTGTLSTRLNGLVDHFKMALDCFFAVWFVVGNVWIFGGQSSPSDAPKLYRLCIVFLTFSCIGYAMPFILCATICCCLPCIISVLGFREDFSQTRGATVESINALPIYMFKLKKSGNGDNDEGINLGADEGGVLAAGTEKERVISGEDAVCCICLAKYADNDELRELPCFHVFHVECVDKWLKINALCPLCKYEIGDSSSNSPSTIDTARD